MRNYSLGSFFSKFSGGSRTIRILLVLWITPLILFWGWYWTSYFDLRFGTMIFSRRLHDVIFRIYGEILGIDPTTIPPLLARACVLDSILVAALVAFRLRRPLLAFLGERRARYFGARPASSP